MQIQTVVITDLDGTLLDHDTYDWQAAKPALKHLKSLNIPIILNTSKTRSEVDDLVKRIGLPMLPYLVENGSALVIPDRLTNWKADALAGEVVHLPEQMCSMVTFGLPRTTILNWIKALPKSISDAIDGYRNWSLDDIAEFTGLSSDEARLSAQKEFSEPFIWKGNESDLGVLTQLAEEAGLNILKGGRFYHLQGNVDKSTIIDVLRAHYRSIWPNRNGLCQIALGDGENDVGMLNRADFSVCIRSPSHEFPIIRHIDVIYSEKYGPQGWNEEILKLIKKLNL